MSLPVSDTEDRPKLHAVRKATDRHDRGPNYYYGKNRAGSCSYLYKNQPAKREIARINVRFPWVSTPPLSGREFIERKDRSTALTIERKSMSHLI